MLTCSHLNFVIHTKTHKIAHGKNIYQSNETSVGQTTNLHDVKAHKTIA
jgi:hypothetical protein